MKKLVPLILLSILIITPIFFFEDTDSRYEKLSKSLLCPVCQGETLFDSPSEYANDTVSYTHLTLPTIYSV